MSLMNYIKSKCHQLLNTNITVSQNDYVDSSSISPDEKPFYQPDEYYTFYSYPNTEFAKKVITFEERKKISYPTSGGLYVAEIMLLEYCSYGKYPKPKGGYPGFWWFKYGIRDVGHSLESLEQRGFIRWASIKQSLVGLTVAELRKILSEAGLNTTGTKAVLIERINTEIPEVNLNIADYTPKYELTEIGKAELAQNGYIPYMHKHKHSTTENSTLGEAFNVWSINKLFKNGDSDNWKQVVGEIEKKQFGVNMVMFDNKEDSDIDEANTLSINRDEMRNYLVSKQSEISKGIKTKGDGFNEESQGLDYKKIGNDKEALVKLYIAIGKKFNAPALYQETAIILRKYGMYEEELSVLNAGLDIVPKSNSHWNELLKRKKKVEVLLNKSQK